MDTAQEPYLTFLGRYPDPILILEGRRIAFANATAATLFGAGNSNDLVGVPVERVFAPASHAIVEECFQSARRDATTWPRALATVLGDHGSERDVDVVVARLDGAETFQLTLRDVSETRRMLRELRDSEERLRLAFAGAQGGVWDWNLETGEVIYSPRWKQMLGYEEDEIEPHVSAWERLLHPDDRAERRTSIAA